MTSDSPEAPAPSRAALDEHEEALRAHSDPLEGVPWLADEFILWLWYRSERDFTTFRLTNEEAVDLWIDDRLAFTAADEKSVVSTFRGGAPSTLPEARLSVLSGRRISEVRLGMRRGEAEWSFQLRVRPGEIILAGLKIPSVVKDGTEEMIYERMYLTDAVTDVLADLFGQFFALRSSEVWENEEGPAIRAWLTGGDTAGDGYSS